MTYKFTVQSGNMEDESVVVAACCCSLIIGAAAVSEALCDKRRKHRVWVKEYLRKRQQYGCYHSLLPDLAQCDKVKFANFIRMEWNDFERLFAMIEPLIIKRTTKFRYDKFVNLLA
jgi:hypothetical protein